MLEKLSSTPLSVHGPEVSAIIEASKQAALSHTAIQLDQITMNAPVPSPEDWRDLWIYFLLVDRFNNPTAPPHHADPWLPYQGGNFEGIKQQLPYLRSLGVGAIWISPVLMNHQAFTDYYGGYAIQDFMRIEPRFCRNPAQARQNPDLADQEFRELIDAIHAAGMYVILDIVLNHTGDLFDYEGMRDIAPWNPGGPYRVYWRDGNYQPHGDWTEIETIPSLPREAGVWPEELQRNEFFRRRGDYGGSPDPVQGDFGSLRDLVTEYWDDAEQTHPVRDFLIRAHQYLIARFDIDGFRTDTLMYVERDFARVFANAMREFALSIGKKNFFTFGEVWKDNDETKIAEYIGRNTVGDEFGIIGYDAALDFALRWRLEGITKGVVAPKELADHMAHRQAVQRKIISSHGEASAYFVTFLENHDLNYRFATSCRPEQVTLALTCLFTLQGIPCIYYGMEQGFNDSGSTRESVRECLWRTPVFTQSPQHPLYRTIRALSGLRREQPALRYGRVYFRQLTGNGFDFGFSEYAPGVLAFSRLLNDSELLIVANTNQTDPIRVEVVVDRHLYANSRQPRVLYSNLGTAGMTPPQASRIASGRAVVPVTLRALEAQVIG